MTDAFTHDTEAEGADNPTAVTDGIHLVVDALKDERRRDHLRGGRHPDHRPGPPRPGQGIRYIGFRHESNAGHAAAAAGFLRRSPASA